MKKLETENPLVTIIGRTNVGKSTIFNRLTEQETALTSAQAGTTRDSRIGDCLWQGKTINLIDTAGLDVESDQEIDRESVDQAKKSLEKADLILLVVDGKQGLLPQDKEYARLAQKTNKPVFLVINKIDSPKIKNQTADFFKLGLENVYQVSAKTGFGTGDLLDDVNQVLKSKFSEKKSKERLETENRPVEIKIALLGKPNVGKSSLLNKIAGEKLAVVSQTPHTTRDSQDITMEFESQEKTYLLNFIDTAGIIKKRKIKNKINQYSIEQSLESLQKSQITLLLIDASEPITTQDKSLAREILDQNKSLIFVINKWDKLKDKTTYSDREYVEFLHKHFPFLTWAPIVFTSTKKGFKAKKLLNLVVEIYQNQRRKLSQEKLDDFLKYLLKKKSPPQQYGKKPSFIYQIKQAKVQPLTFEITAKRPENIPTAYRRFIKKTLRNYFNYLGCGIKLRFVEK